MEGDSPGERYFLALDSSKAKVRLAWDQAA